MKKLFLAAALAAITGAAASAQSPTNHPPAGPGGSYVSGTVTYGGPEGSAGIAGPAGYVGTPYGHTGISHKAPGTGKFWARKWFGGPILSSSQNLTAMPTLPVFMAAPWYNYFPYDGHFQTIAPMSHGLYYPPPLYTGNPYLTGQYPGYVPGAPVPQYPVAGFNR